MADPSEPRMQPADGAEDHFRRIAENVRQIFWLFDVRGHRLLYVNPAYEQVTGRTVESLYADPTSWREAVHPEDRSRIEEIEFSRDYDAEFRIVRPDGRVRWIWIRGVPIRGARGVLRQIVGVAEDITQRKRTEHALEQSLSLLRATLDATTDGILALDLDGQITIFNRRFVELWRIPEFIAIEAGQEQAIWAYVLDQLADPASFTAEMDRVREHGRTDSFDVLELKDDRVFDRHSRPERIGDRIIGRVWSFRDTTDRTRAERALRSRTRRLELQNDVLLRIARRNVADPADRQTAFEHITEAAADMLETERVGIWLFESERRKIRLCELFQRTGRRHSAGTVLARDDAPSYFLAIEGERALAVDDVGIDARTRELAGSYCAPLGITSMLDAPVRAGGMLVGIVCFEHVGPARRWTIEEQSFAGSIADLASITIETADHQQAEARVRFLARASAVLASSLDYRTTLANVARLTMPTVADFCVIDLFEDGQIRRVASAHRDPEKEQLIRELERRYPPDWESRQPAAVALRSGEPQLLPDVNDVAFTDRGRDAYHEELIRGLGIRSCMAVPLVARNRTLGVITFGSSKIRYGADALTFAQDIAARAAIAIDNARLHERAQEASKAKSDFLAVVSHELRTPLSAVMGYTDLLEDGIAGPVTPEQRHQLQRIRLRSQDLLRILEEILAFSRTETGRVQRHIETTDLSRLVRDVGAIVRPVAEARGLAFEVHAPDTPVLFSTDAGKLKHILLNLLSNAVKFTERGGIQLDARTEDGHAVFEVRDTGHGIAAADQERIFEPFVQVEDAMTRETGGTGLGLAVVRRFARLLGGDVELASAPGEGSTFTIRLPPLPDSGDDGR